MLMYMVIVPITGFHINDGDNVAINAESYAGINAATYMDAYDDIDIDIDVTINH